MSSFSSSSVQAIPVRMGSHRMCIDIVLRSNAPAAVNASQFIKMALKRCRLSDSDVVSKTYALFERVNGIERALKSSDNVLAAWFHWSARGQDVEFVIRKCTTTEKRLMSASERPVDQQLRNSQYIKKCYQRAKQMDTTERGQDKFVNVEQVLASARNHNKSQAVKKASQVDLNNNSMAQKPERKAKSVKKVTFARANVSVQKVETSDAELQYSRVQPSKINENINFIKCLYLRLRHHATYTKKETDYLLFSESEDEEAVEISRVSSRTRSVKKSSVNSNGSSRSPSLSATD